MSEDDPGRNGQEPPRTIIEPDDSTIREGLTVLEGRRAAPEKQTRPATFRGFEIVEEFPARGGEADIYLVQEGEERLVLKLYRRGMEPDEQVLATMKELSARFPEHVVGIREFGRDEESGKWYEIQEYAEKSSLREFAGSRLEPAFLRNVVREIERGLEVLHTHNVLHLDLKPSNVLVKGTDPLDLVFTDFGVSSVLDEALTRKMTSVKGTPHYWSPEAFTGVVGKEADFWSLGMIVYEFLTGRHPFSGIDTKVIMYTLATKGVKVEEDVPEDYRPLLKGLLTREPHLRWGAEQVRRWLDGDREIPIHYRGDTEGDGKYGTPLKILDSAYYSLPELAAGISDKPEEWMEAKKYLAAGYLTRWAEESSDFTSGMELKKIIEAAMGEEELALLRMVYTFDGEAPFAIYGKLVTPRNLYLYVSRFMQKEHTEAEGCLVDDLVRGRLLEYYRDYLSLTGREPDETCRAIEAVKAVAEYTPQYLFEYGEELESAFKMLEIFVQPGDYVLPREVMASPADHVGFLVRNFRNLRKTDDLKKVYREYDLPLELEGALRRASSGETDPNRVRLMDLLQDLIRDHILLTKKEAASLPSFVLPREVAAGVTGEDTDAYVEGVKRLRELQERDLLIGGREFRDYAGLRRTGFDAVLEEGELRRNSDGRALDFEEYVDVARLVKRRVDTSMLPTLEKVHDVLQPLSADDRTGGTEQIWDYVERLHSLTVPWETEDRSAVREIHDALFAGDVTPGELLGRETGDTPPYLGLLELLGCVFPEGSTAGPRWAAAGAGVGLIFALISVGVILIAGTGLTLAVPFICTVVLGALGGWRIFVAGIILALLLSPFYGAELGFGEVFADFLFLALTGMAGGARMGERMGLRREKIPEGDRISREYADRIAEVLRYREGGHGDR